jgi:peptide/nickel transport system permease protein
VILGQNYEEELAAQISQRLLLDEPLHVQYINWITGVIQGDLGDSFVIAQGQPVSGMLINRLPVTLELTIFSIVIALFIAIPAGVVSAVERDTIFDHAARIAALTGVSLPSFFLGVALILLFGVYLSFPWASGGYTPLQESVSQNLKKMFLPAITLGTAYSAVIMRMLRSTMLDVLDQEYIQVGRAFGIGETRLTLVDAVRNAFIPVITVIGTSMGRLLGGAVITETIFRMPGIGRLIVTGVEARDYPVVQGTVLFIAVIFLVINLLVDISYSYIDPRIRYEGGR